MLTMDDTLSTTRGKWFNCQICRTMTPQRSAPQKFCPECAAKRYNKRASDAWYARKRATVPLTLGQPYVCEKCGEPGVRTGTRQKYCAKCRKPEWPRIIACEDCGRDVVAERSTRRICKECKAKRFDYKANYRRYADSKGTLPRGTVVTRMLQCDSCDAEFAWTGQINGIGQKKSCDGCVKARHNERVRKRTLHYRIAAGAQIVGSALQCASCEREFVKHGTYQKYCRECMDQRDTLWREQNRDYLRQYANNYERQRRRSDPKYALRKRMHSLVLRSLRERKAGRSWKEFVDYGLDDLMVHLERQFLPGMTWDNRRKWHIDHIVPLSSFKFETADDPEFKAAWALHNLRPLWGRENLRKQGKRTHLL